MTNIGLDQPRDLTAEKYRRTRGILAYALAACALTLAPQAANAQLRETRTQQVTSSDGTTATARLRPTRPTTWAQIVTSTAGARRLARPPKKSPAP